MKMIGIVGSRQRNLNPDYRQVLQAFCDIFKEGDEIVSGGCSKGGDRFAEKIAKENFVPIHIYYANWVLGRHAGFLRNTTIAEKADVLIACVAPDRTGGTEDTIKKFKKENNESRLYLV